MRSGAVPEKTQEQLEAELKKLREEIEELKSIRKDDIEQELISSRRKLQERIAHFYYIDDPDAVAVKRVVDECIGRGLAPTQYTDAWRRNNLIADEIREKQREIAKVQKGLGLNEIRARIEAENAELQRLQG